MLFIVMGDGLNLPHSNGSQMIGQFPFLALITNSMSLAERPYMDVQNNQLECPKSGHNDRELGIYASGMKCI